MNPPGDLLHDEVLRVSTAMQSQVEQRMRLYVRPKPRRLPAWAWRALLRWLLTLALTRPTAVRAEARDRGLGENNPDVHT